MEEAKSTSGKPKLSLSLKNMFKKTSKEELYIRKMTLPQVPNNTSVNTRWTIKNLLTSLLLTIAMLLMMIFAQKSCLPPVQVICLIDGCVYLYQKLGHTTVKSVHQELYILFQQEFCIIFCFRFNNHLIMLFIQFIYSLMMASKVLTNHSACIKHQRVIHALSAMYHIYIPVKSFEV